MTLQTKIEPIEDWINITVNETLAPSGRSKVVAEFAREKLSDAQDTNRQILGRVPAHQTFVDGRSGAPLESVNPDHGRIVFEFELMTDVLRWIGQQLVNNSPVISGDYVRGHTLFADGKEIPLGGTIPPAEEYSFTNLVPYARKIEVGKTKGGRAFVIQVQPKVYDRTARDARARFGNFVKIESTFRGIIGRSSGSGTQINPHRDPTRGAARARGRSGRFSSMGGPKAYNRSELRYPTIVITHR